MDTAATSIPNWVTLLIQVPLVGVFIWYSLQAQQRFMDSLDKRDAAFERRNEATINAINTMQAAIMTELRETNQRMDEHDRYVRANVARNRSQRE